MKLAIVSDLHSNVEASDAVMKDIEAESCDKIYCLGNILGAGPNPREVLETAMNLFSMTLSGDREEALLSEREGLTDTATPEYTWIESQLDPPNATAEESAGYWDFLAEVAQRREVTAGDLYFVHGSPRDPTHESVFPKDILDQRKINEMFAKFDRLCFCGHSCIPGIYREDGKYGHPKNLKDGELDLRRYRKLLINVGSVGESRDHDRRACYAIVDGYILRFRRVEYDWDKTDQKMRELRRGR